MKNTKKATKPKYANGFLENKREENYVIRRVTKMTERSGKVPYGEIMKAYNSHYGKNCHVSSLVSFVRTNRSRIFGL